MPKPQEPTEHRMNRRSKVNDYTQPGMYHITLRVADDVGRPFGCVVGDASLPDGSDDAPHVELSVVGQMVKDELLNSIRTYYPMVEVQDYVVMPEHMHFIIEVHEALVSRRGIKAHLGQVIAGFKKGCNRRYWEITGQGKPASIDGGAGGSCSAVSPQRYKVPSRASSGRQVLFEDGYVDVMPLHKGQLQQQRVYIRNNPRSRLLRSTHRDVLQPQRGGIDTALSINALRYYLKRECAPWQVTPEALALVESHLLITDSQRGKPADADTASQRGKPADADTAPQQGKPAPTNSGAERAGNGGSRCVAGMITCDSYGYRELLSRRMLPVVCHRKDKALFDKQKARCLLAAQEGAVLVSARIAKGEQEILDTVQAQGFPVILVMDNGMPTVFHPSAERIEQCLNGQLLLVTPWQYEYRAAEMGISVVQCKTMNCVVQALCRMNDQWWKGEQ